LFESPQNISFFSCAGFLSTLDQYAPGNYGLMIIIKVLEFIQKYITLFRGDPDKVTLVGHDSGAAAIALLLLSPKAKYDNVVGKYLINTNTTFWLKSLFNV